MTVLSTYAGFTKKHFRRNRLNRTLAANMLPCLATVLLLAVLIITFSDIRDSVFSSKKQMCGSDGQVIFRDGVIYTADLRQFFPNETILVRDLRTTNTTGRCEGSIKGRRIAINYASNCCAKSQLQNCQTAITAGGFDVCVMMNEKSLDDEFRLQHRDVLSVGTGGGYWLWKPYIISKMLFAMNKDDVLFYSDSGTHFIGNFDLSHICLQQQLDQDIVVYTDTWREDMLTKADTFVLMGVDPKDSEFAETPQFNAAFFLARKTARSTRFVGEWLTYAEDIRIVGNNGSKFAPDSANFYAHRNDQSVLSLLAKRWRLEGWPDPSQYGLKKPLALLRAQERFRLINQTVINHTRDRS